MEHGVHVFGVSMKKTIQMQQHILTELKKDINALLGFHEGIPRINYGPCAVFAKLFYDAWNTRFSEKVHICFVMTLDGAECDHVVIKFPWGEFYDGGIGLHTDASCQSKFIIDEMLVYDHDKLEQWSYGLDRTYPRFCPNFDKKAVDDLINKCLDRIKNT